MSGQSRAAALPASGWRPHQRHDGCTVFFVSEDGSQRKTLNLSFPDIDCAVRLKEQLAAGVASATGPRGDWNRLASAKNLVQAARFVCNWIASTRPELTDLGQLTKADARMLAHSIPRATARTNLRALLKRCDGIPPWVEAEVARRRIKRDDKARQPYDDAEITKILTLAKAIVRRARDRIWSQRALLADYRAGLLDHLDERDGRRCLAQALDHCDQLADMPRSPNCKAGNTDRVGRRAIRYLGGEGLMPQLYLTSHETWAFAVLLAGLTGKNKSVTETLPAPHLRATALTEPPIALVDTNKPRRGPRARGVMPLDALPEVVRASLGSDDVSPVAASSLNSPYGVFALLVDLTEPARRHLRSDRALIYFARHRDEKTGSVFQEGIPEGVREASGSSATWPATPTATR